MKGLLVTAMVCLAVTVVTSAQEWSPVIANRAIYSIAANPQNPNTLYAGNIRRTFFRSYDGGASWEELPIGESDGFSQISILLVHPVDTAIIFAAGPGLDGLARSTDNGATWQNVLQASIGRLELNGGGAVAFDPSAPTTMYAIRNRFGEVYRSNNAGLEWELHSTIPNLENTDNLKSITVHPDSSNVLLVGGRRPQVYRSQDGGITWDSATMNMTPRFDEDIARFAWSPTQPGTVYATVQRSLFQLPNSAGMYRSTDHGLTWERWRFIDTSLYTLHVSAGSNGDEIFVGGNQIPFPVDSGLIRGDSIVMFSDDGGSTWQDLSDVPWMKNEAGEVGSNIWGVVELPLASIPGERARRFLLATEGGLFRRDIVTGVTEAPFTPKQITTVVLSGNTLTYDPALAPTEIHILDLKGALMRTQAVTTPGRLDLSDLPHGTYLIELHGTETTAVLVQK